MNQPYGPGRWLPWVVGFVLLAVAATVAYNIGLNQGLAGQGTAAAPVVYRGWHGFGPFWLLFGLFFFFAIFRGCAWGWGGPRYWRYHRGYYRYWDDEVPPDFEEWHRRAHEKEKDEPPRPSGS